MFRIGKLTGRVYGEEIEPSSIGECCITVNRKEDLDEELKDGKLKKLSNDCEFCRGCPEYHVET